MVDVSSSKNSITIKVESANKTNSITTTPSVPNNSVSATADTAQYWSKQSRLFAENSKESAQEAKNYAELANSYIDGFEGVVTNNTNNIIATSNDYINQITGTANTALTDIEDARVDAVGNITTTRDESIASVEAKRDEVLSAVNEGIAEINNTKTNAVNAVTTTKNNAVTEINKEVTDGKKELNDIIEAGGSNINNKITNCILEVPQNIKLELNNGTLTLKAGSKVIVPNGVGVFDEVVITSDLTYTRATNKQEMVVVRTSGGSLLLDSWFNHSSGSSAPSVTDTYMLWYDTANNKIKGTGDNGATWNEAGYSLPIAQITTTGSISSIDQIFNGMGYIGSTVWVDKGVKVLIPNGRNADGTLNNREEVTPKVYTVTAPGTFNNYSLVLNKDGLYILSQFNTVSGSQPTTSGPCYTIETNKVYNNGGQRYWIHLANFSTNAGVFTNLDFKLPFRAVDYNDFKKLHVNNPYFFGQYIWSEFAPSNLSWLKSSGQWNSGSGYQAFYDWALTNANANKAGFKLSTASYTDYDFVINTTAKTFRLPIKVQNTPLNDTASVAGNGKVLGLTLDGQTTYASPITVGYSKSHYMLGFGQYNNNDLPLTNLSVLTQSDLQGVGVTPVTSESGLVANLSANSNLSLYFYVGETVRDEFLIDVGQIASSFADKLDRGNKAEIISWGMPDYSAGISVDITTSDKSFTAPCDGLYVTMPYTDGLNYLIVIGVATVYGYEDSSSGEHVEGVTIPLGKNDVIKWQNNLYSSKAYYSTFFPLKGVN